MTRRSEFALIAAFRERLPAPHGGVLVGSGDDAAVVRAGGSHSVISVDTTVDGVHARLDLGDPLQTARDFGWRSLTTALSDLAACGVGQPGIDRLAPDRSDDDAPDDTPSFVWAIPADTPQAPGIEAYVAVTLPAGLEDERILAIADGMAEAARTFGVSVVGGDVTSGPVAVISTTVVGWLDDPALTRSHARPTNLVGLTGPIGAAGAGLALTLGAPASGAAAREPGGAGAAAGPSDAEAAALRGAYMRPVPHLSAGAALRAAGATAAIDLSDGLLADALHLARSSGVSLALDATEIPLAAGVDAVARGLGRDPLLFAQSAGEDFVLLVTVPVARRIAAEDAGVVAWIGHVTEVAAGDHPEVTGLPFDSSGRAGHDHRA